MPQRTIAPGGGNWNSTSTWVEGAIPTTSDFVVGNASSGQLTINVAATCQYVDFTNYTNTLTFTNNLTTNLASATNIFGVGMNFAGTGQYQFYNSPGSITQNTTNRIPLLAFANGTKTLNTNLYCNEFNLNGTITINNNTIFTYTNVNMGFNSFNGTTNLHLLGSGTLQIFGWNGGELLMNTSGTYTINNRLGIGNTTSNKNTTFTHQQGTIINPNLSSTANFGTSITTFNLIAGTTWDFFYRITSGSALINILNFQGTCNFNDFILASMQSVSAPSSITYYQIQGANLNINNFSTLVGMETASGIFSMAAFEVRLDENYTYTINNSFQANGNIDKGQLVQNPQIAFRSITPSSSVALNINTFNQYVSTASFTDINCSGGNTLYGQNLTLLRTTNITQYTLPPSTGGASSYTFIS